MALNIVESKMLEALETVKLYLTQGTINRGEYSRLMATVRDAIKAGHNKKYGCPSGLHATYCTCKEGTPGINKAYFKYGKAKRNG